MSIYDDLGVRRVINASGIYTDLGGSVLGEAAWAAAAEANRTWASMPELLVFVDDLASALAAGPAAILHPAHLDGTALGIDAVAGLARAAGVPVVVDAAYLSFPLSALERWSTAGDLACLSPKYFGDALVFCTETLTPDEVGEIVYALTRTWVGLADG